MRKSLLMTSALCLTTILPTLAMAGASASSSSAVCNSGFFAQFDAKIMNAKLEIKNEKKNTPVEADANVDAAAIAAELKAKIIGNLSNVDVVTFFDLDIGADTAAKQVVLGVLTAYTLSEVETDTQLRAILANPVIIGLTNEQKAAVTTYIKQLRVLGQEAALESNTILGNVLGRRAAKLGDVEFIVRDVGDDQAAVVAKMTASEVTSNGQDFRRIKTIYVLGAGNSGNTLDTTALTRAVRDNFSEAAFKTAFETLVTTGAGQLPFANLVKITQDANTALNQQLKKRRALPDYADRRVHHNALAGGVGATVGWWQNLGGFGLTISGSGDYHWGTFRTMDDAAGATVNAADKRKLGFAVQGDIGVHYVVSPSTTLGVLVGIRGQQLNIGKTNTAAATTSSTNSKDGDYASKWMINPVVSLQARTFFTDNVYGALTVGYIIPLNEKDYAVENTNIDKDAKLRFQGLTGAFSVGMVF